MSIERISGYSHFVEKILTADKTGDVTAMRQHTVKLVQQLQLRGTLMLDDEWKRLLPLLKSQRLFEELREIAELLLQVGHTQTAIRCFYAQGLTEGGRMSAALSVLSEPLAEAFAAIERKQIIDDGDVLEALGLCGRAHKQIYIEFARQTELNGTPLPEAARQALLKAKQAYGGVLTSGGKLGDGWHEINYVATATLAERLEIVAPQSSGVEQIATNLIRSLSPKVGEEGGNPWYAATVGEAYLVFEQWREAAKYYGLFASHKDIKAFNLASAIRQLEEIWQLDRMGGVPEQIIKALKMRMLSLPGGELHLNGGAIRTMGEGIGPAWQTVFGDIDPNLEAVFGQCEPINIGWFEKGLRRAKSVARIKLNGRPQGTGFLVPGRELSPLLEDKPYLLTNAHVVSDPRDWRPACPPDYARIFFEEADGCDQEEGYKCTMVWTSGVNELDATLLELETGVPPLDPFHLAKSDLLYTPEMAQSGKVERVNVIGHPGSEKLSISLQDNQVLDVGPRDEPTDGAFIFYHYKTPTKRGNSGSPVCNGDDWVVYALHHSGPQQRLNSDGIYVNAHARLRGREGFYVVNEGISIVSIRQQIHNDLTAALPPRGSTGPDVPNNPNNPNAANAPRDPLAHAAE